MKNNSLSAAFREVYKKTPKIVKKTTAKKGKAAGERQRKKIALEKARRRGAKIPKK